MFVFYTSKNSLSFGFAREKQCLLFRLFVARRRTKVLPDDALRLNGEKRGEDHQEKTEGRDQPRESKGDSDENRREQKEDEWVEKEQGDATTAIGRGTTETRRTQGEGERIDEEI